MGPPPRATSVGVCSRMTLSVCNGHTAPCTVYALCEVCVKTWTACACAVDALSIYVAFRFHPF